jgi:ribonuclease J
MLNVLELAQKLNYIKIPDKMLIDINETKDIPDHKLTIITTGSQGEPMSALARMASGNHKAIKIKKDDKIILSSSPIPGNEKTVSNIVNKLFELGADVIYSDIADIHVSGHACEEEIKVMLSLIRPKYYMPVHGEYRHLHRNSDIAESLGIKKNNIFLLENGQILEVKNSRATISKNRVEADPVFVDGLGVGDVGDVVLNDRRLLSESGLIVVAIALDRSTGEYVSGPDVFSRGFVYVAENAELLEDARDVVSDTLKKCMNNGIYDMKSLKSAIIKDLRRYIYERTQRNPVILPYFMEV